MNPDSLRSMDACTSISISLRRVLCIALAAGASFAAATDLEAQAGPGDCQPSWLPTFGGLPGTDGRVDALVEFDDGGGPALFVGGNFTNAGGVAAIDIARWDGTSWSPIDNGSNSLAIDDLAVFDDGDGPALHGAWLVSYSNGTAVSSVAKWDGTSWSTLGSVMGLISALAVYDDGSGPALYVGGDFTSAGGVAASNLAKWDGATWSAVGGGVSGAFVHCLVVYDDGSGPALHAGGLFTSVGGVAADNIAKWDGTSWSALGEGLNGCPYPGTCLANALAVFDDGSGPALYAGGQFVTAGGVSARNIARWDGSTWSPLAGGLNAQGEVFALASYGNALHAGGFDLGSAQLAPKFVASWNGTRNWTFPENGPDAFVTELAIFDHGTGAGLFAGGTFASVGGVEARGIARSDGAEWSELGRRLEDRVDCLLACADEAGPALYVGGDFISTGEVAANRIARWDGTAWSALGSGMNGSVRALATYDDGGGPALHAAGDFTAAGGVSASRIAKWDGTSWSALSSTVFNSSIRALAVLDLGAGPVLFAGGDFTFLGGTSSRRMAQWDGTSWTPQIGTGFNGTVRCLTVFDDGGGPTVYAGGSFQLVGGQQVRGIAKLNSNGSTWSGVGAGFNDGDIHALAVFDSGDGSGPALYAGGGFRAAGGGFEYHVWRWNGASWTTLGSGMNALVESLGVFDDGDGAALFTGGTFTAAGGATAHHCARWSGASWTSVGGGMNASVDVLATFDDAGVSGPALFAAGAFDMSPAGDSYLARWQGCLDTIAPTISCPTSVFQVDSLTGPPGEIVFYSVEVSDDRDPAPALVCSPPSGSFFPRGTTIVTCTATDDAGNQSTCQFPVTVVIKVRRQH